MKQFFAKLFLLSLFSSNVIIAQETEKITAAAYYQLKPISKTVNTVSRLLKTERPSFSRQLINPYHAFSPQKEDVVVPVEKKIPENGIYVLLSFEAGMSFVKANAQNATAAHSAILFGGHFQMGYQAFDHLRFGLGVGAAYISKSLTMPIYANIQWLILKSSNTPFVECSGGTQISFLNGRSKSGLYIRPALGYRFPSQRLEHCAVDLGVSIEDRYQTQLALTNPKDSSSYYRFYFISLRLSIVF